MTLEVASFFAETSPDKDALPACASLLAEAAQPGQSEATQSETADAHALKIGGLTLFTATDFPGKLAAAIFVQGCPWQCRYCHAPQLRIRTAGSAIAWEQVLTHLRQRVGMLDGVVFSGGEPTLDPALGAALDAVRALGFATGLHTACSYPERLAALLPRLDWIGFDVKAPFDAYARATGVAGSGRAMRASIETIVASGIAHECRTTIHPDLLAPGELLALATTLAGLGVQNYVLQAFQPQGCSDAALAARAPHGYPGPELLRTIAPMFKQFGMRHHAHA